MVSRQSHRVSTHRGTFRPLEADISNRPNRGFLTAFTLVELLVVIAIIALLMAILMPAMARVRQQARAVACRSKLSQWGKVFTMFTMDNDGYFASSSMGMWTHFLDPYYKDPELRLCPTASKLAEPVGGLYPYGSTHRAWGKFDASYAQYGLEGLYGSYGMNGHVSNDRPADEDPYGRDLLNNWRKADVRGGYQVPLFLDCIWLGGAPEPLDEPPTFEGFFQPTPLGVNMQGFCIDRHQGGINGLFLDSSTRKVGLKELWRLKWHKGFEVSADPPSWPDWMKEFKDYD